jgi:CII-binding regulator of phage lambda lysogenization HflD
MHEESRLTEAVETLRAEIDALDENDSESRAKLEQLLMDLEERLKQPRDTGNDNDLADQLKESMLHFETSHPALTGILNDIMIKLSSIGV